MELNIEFVEGGYLVVDDAGVLATCRDGEFLRELAETVYGLRPGCLIVREFDEVRFQEATEAASARDKETHRCPPHSTTAPPSRRTAPRGSP